VVPDAELPQWLEALAAKVAAGARGSNSAVKKLLLSTYSAGYEAQLEHEARHIAGNASSPDGKEGIAAFLGKRAPEFS
jgi:2-(1,2-epoxy-1,2-dihydrophenyl)acetyl-CoA isomerase